VGLRSILRTGAARVAAGIRAAFTYDAHTALTESNEAYYRELGQRRLRDVPPWSQQRMQNDSVRAVQRFPMARRGIAIIAGFVVGAGPIRPRSENKLVQAKLDAFWDAPRNAIGPAIGQWALDLSTMGEHFVLLNAGASSSLTNIGLLDPGYVFQVLCDPNDMRLFTAALVKRPSGQVVAHPIIQSDNQTLEPFRYAALGSKVPVDVPGTGGGLTDAIVGVPCIYRRINALSYQSRGLSDLYPALDALALKDRAHFNFMERACQFGAFVWDLALPNSMKSKQVTDEGAKAAAAISSGMGGVFSHTENVKLEAKSPKLDAADQLVAMNIINSEILSALGLPEMWFATGTEKSLASAGEMGSATWTMLQERQNVIREIVMAIGDYALAQFPEVMALPKEEREWEVTLPKIVGKDAVREITVLVQEINAVATLHDALGLTDEAAQREAAASAREYGFEVGQGDWGKIIGLQGFKPQPFPKPGAAPKAVRDGGGLSNPDGQTSDERQSAPASRAA
jgi:hypothetical protein